MDKVDLKKEIAAYSARAGRVDVVDVPAQRYLAIDGQGDPNDADGAYAAAIGTLFPVSYALKFASRRELDRDYVVMPLEALWWAEDMSSFTSARDKTAWSWTAMILVPAWIPDELIDRVRADADAPALDRLRVLALDEGRCVQTLHIGPYDAEAPALARLHDEVIPSLGLRMTGRHHEVYLSDARRTDPAKLRTILRQPVVAA
jgi:hypothetical protein